MLKKLSLHAGQEILDVGCGLGGAAFIMAQVRASINAFFEQSARDDPIMSWRRSVVKYGGQDQSGQAIKNCFRRLEKLVLPLTQVFHP